MTRFDDEYAPFTYEPPELFPKSERPVPACAHRYGNLYTRDFLGALYWSRSCVSCSSEELMEKVKV